MADTPRPDPFSDVISLVAGPIAAVIRSFDQLRRGAEELMKGLENFNATMENLNDTAGRVNRLLNDFEEPIRAMLPQLTRTVKLADELSARLSGPIDQVAPGLARLADTLNSPVLMALPTDLGAFLDIINDLSRRMSPLAQVFEQAGGLFGMRLPGMPARQATPAPAAAPPPPPPEKAPGAKKAPAKKRAAKKKAPAKKSAARKSAAR
jgi:ABC-type transporter Mla subunit MlaD